MSGCLLVLVPVLSLCGATEYYVRPTESTNTSCPGQPCLTLSQYSNYSEHYFKSNTVFKFLPGTHHIDKPVRIRNIKNISLESFSNQSDQYPLVVAQFHSELEVSNCDSTNIYYISRDAISFDSVADVVLKGINVTVRTPNIFGIVFWNVSNINVQSTTVHSYSNKTCAFGIVVSYAESVQVSSVSTYKFSTGIYIRSSNNVNITLVTTRYNKQEGIQLKIVHNAHITNTTTTHNGGVGIFIDTTSYIILNRTITKHNKLHGIYLQHTNNAHLINTIATHNDRKGMVLIEANNTRIINTTAMYNNQTGIQMVNLDETLILNTKLHSNGVSGLLLYGLNNTRMMNTTASFNKYIGIFGYTLTNTLVSNAVSLNNSFYGVYMQDINNTKIINTITRHNVVVGMFLHSAINTTISRAVATNNSGHGINLQVMRSTWLTNITAMNNDDYGIIIEYMKIAHIINVTAAFNNNGILLNITNNTKITSVSVMYNMGGMMLLAANDSNITALTASYNEGNGLSLALSHNINIIVARVLENKGRAFFVKPYSLEFGYFFRLEAQISILSSTETVIQNSSFVGINVPYSVGTTNPSLQPAIIALYQSTLEISDCSFKQNHISAVTAHESNITLSGNVVFSNNTAVSGTAFILVQGSIISLVKNSNVKFENNYATNTGGVLYIGNDEHVYLSGTFSHRKCFLNIPVDRSQIQFIFVNNSAGMGGDILYGGQVASSFDGNWNCLESFENISTINVYQNDFSLISSDPSRICFCTEDRLPDCLTLSTSSTHSYYPGQNIYISAVTVGENFGTVAGSVYAQYLKKSLTDNQLELNPSQKVQSTTQYGCNWLKYTIYSPNNVSELTLVLTAHETVISITDVQDYFSNHSKALVQQFYHTPRFEPIFYSHIAVHISISIHPCPVGFMLSTDPPFVCICNQLLQQMPGVHCHIHDETFGRSGLVWVGMTQDDNGTNGTLTVSQYCPLNYCNKRYGNVTLDTPSSQCNYNHSGILCGACQPGLSLALGSERCLTCSNKYLALLIPFTLAGPVLVGFIKLLDLTVSQGTMNGLIFYANVIQASQYILLPWKSTHILSVFIAWLNLDLGVETCFFEGLDAYYKTWLQFVFPFYIWSIAGLIIILSKYSRRVAKVMGNNSVPVLATLFLLSYAKLFSIIISALSYTILYTSEGRKAVWSADGNVDYLSSKHLLLFVVAVASLFFLLLPYTLIFFLQWLYMCNCRLIDKFLFNVKPFLDAHYAPLKDKHCYWFGALHLVRAAILLISSLAPADHSSIVTISILASAVVLTFVGSIVYQRVVITLFNVGFFLNLILISGASLYTQIMGGESTTYAYILIGLAFLQFIGLLLFNVFAIFRRSSKVMAYLHVCMKQHVEDDWELFEQAALLRERELESEEEGSEDSGSMESLPTY